jgi:hypothetical protein
MPIDLADAIFQTLRNSPQVVDAFGDTWNSTLDLEANNDAGNVSKFYADYAGQEPLPLAVEMELREVYQDMTHTPGQMAFIADGDFQLWVLASTRCQARQLGDLLIMVLQNAPIMWPGVQPMDCRLKGQAFVPRTNIGPAAGLSIASVFQRVLTFGYEYSGVRNFPPTGGNP